MSKPNRISGPLAALGLSHGHVFNGTVKPGKALVKGSEVADRAPTEFFIQFSSKLTSVSSSILCLMLSFYSKLEFQLGKKTEVWYSAFDSHWSF